AFPLQLSSGARGVRACVGRHYLHFCSELSIGPFLLRSCHKVPDISPASHLQPFRNPFIAHRCFLSQSPCNRHFAFITFSTLQQFRLSATHPFYLLLHNSFRLLLPVFPPPACFRAPGGAH